MSTPNPSEAFYNTASDALNAHGTMQGDGIYFTLPFDLDGAQRSLTIDSYATGMTEQGVHFSRMGTSKAEHEGGHRRLLREKLGWLSFQERDTDGYATENGLSFTALRPSTDVQGFARPYVDRQAPDFDPDAPIVYDFRAEAIVADPLRHPVLSVVYQRLVELSPPETT